MQVFEGFWKFLEVFEHARTCSDPCGPIRTCLDAFGYSWVHSDAFGTVWTFSDICNIFEYLLNMFIRVSTSFYVCLKPFQNIFEHLLNTFEHFWEVLWACLNICWTCCWTCVGHGLKVSNKHKNTKTYRHMSVYSVYAI